MKRTKRTNLQRAPVMCGVMVMGLVLGLGALGAGAAPHRLTDGKITDAVQDELQLDSAVPSYAIDITAAEGIVTLSGTVDNILAKERAARIAETVKGVRAVMNKIAVEPSILRTDWEICEDVHDALLEDPATDMYEIDVKVQDNKVTLSGTVQSVQEKELCAAVAKSVKGDKGVNNDIAVVWPEKRSDLEIESEVEKTLRWDAFVDHALIDVEAKTERSS
jgi:osmotically-inducible protein OsmY